MYAYPNEDRIGNSDSCGLAAHLVLLEYGNPTTQALYDLAVSYQPANYNTVVVHGTADGQFAEESPIAYSVVPPESIGRLLESSKGYDPKLPTQSVACTAGASRTSAQALANALHDTVLAPQQVLTAGPTPGATTRSAQESKGYVLNVRATRSTESY